MANLNLDDILAMFENGERRYAEDPAFKAVADSLKMGIGVYAVLDHVLKDTAKIREAANINIRGHLQTISKLQDEVASHRDALELMQKDRDGWNDRPGGRENY